MRSKIFCCTHERPLVEAQNDMFSPIWTGGLAEPSGRWLTDLSGDNIYSESDFGDMRHQYYVWKNLLHDLDYVGFEQYRRQFILDPLPAAECEREFPLYFATRRKLASDSTMWRGEADAKSFFEYLELRRSLDAKQVASLGDWIASFDIILPRRLLSPVNLQWSLCDLSMESWERFTELVKTSTYFSAQPNYIDFGQVGGIYCNMYIMKTELFNEYMIFWEEITSRLKLVVDRSVRYVAYLSERLFSYWVLQKQIENPLLRYAELPYIFVSDYGEVAELLKNR